MKGIFFFAVICKGYRRLQKKVFFGFRVKCLCYSVGVLLLLMVRGVLGCNNVDNDSSNNDGAEVHATRERGISGSRR